MSHTSEQILTAARAIQPEIPRLLKEFPIQEFEFTQTLLILIEQVKTGQATSLDLKEHLTEFKETRQWFLEHFPVSTDDPLRIYHPLPGQGTSIPYPRFKCPDCDYTWSQLESSDVIPSCAKNPNHQSLQRL